MNTIGKIPATTRDVETVVENAVEKLALMINEGFKTTATKDDLKAVTTRLDGMDSRLDRIENLLLAEQKREIEDLKKRMKRPAAALADLRFVQDWIGHASIGNTIIYAQLTSRRRDAEARKVFASQYVV